MPLQMTVNSQSRAQWQRWRQHEPIRNGSGRATVPIEYTSGCRIDPQLGWGRIAGELIVHDIPGSHMEIVEQTGTAVLAQTLRRYLPDDPKAASR